MNPKHVLKKADYPRIALLAARGLREVDIARELGISHTTWRRLRQDDERAHDAWEQGRGEEHEALVGALFKAATKENAGKESITAAIFLLKARHGYRDDRALEVDHNVRVVIELPAPLSPDQWRGLRDVTPKAEIPETAA